MNPESPLERTDARGWVKSAATNPFWAKRTPNITHIEDPSRAALRGVLALGLDGEEILKTFYKQVVYKRSKDGWRVPFDGNRMKGYKAVNDLVDADSGKVVVEAGKKITVRQARLGVGGVAATPVRARQTEAALCGQPWNASTVQQAQVLLQNEFNPLSDLRASRHYRQEVLAQLLQRFWLESQGGTATDLQTLEPLTP